LLGGALIFRRLVLRILPCDVEVQDSATVMLDHEEAIEEAEGQRGHGKEVKGDDHLAITTARNAPSSIEPMHRFELTTCYGLADEASGVVRSDTLVNSESPRGVSQVWEINEADVQLTNALYPVAQEAMRRGYYMPYRGSVHCSRHQCPHWRRCERHLRRMSGQEICIAVNRLHRFRSRLWGPEHFCQFRTPFQSRYHRTSRCPDPSQVRAFSDCELRWFYEHLLGLPDRGRRWGGVRTR
jgi:hypothetical protein